MEVVMNKLVEGTQGEIEDTESWKGHVLTAQNFLGSDQEYCRRNRLNPSTFAGHKKRMGLTRGEKRKRERKFVRLELPEADSGAPAEARVSVQKKALPLPDPKWLAELIQGLRSSP